MIRQNQKMFNYLQVIFDIFIIVLCIILSSLVHWFLFDNLDLTPHISEVILAFIYIVGVHLVCFSMFDMYKSYRSTRFLIEFINLVKATLFSYVVIALTAYSFGILAKTQVILLTFFILNTFFSSLYRLLLRKTLRFARTKGYNQKFLVVLGINACTESFAEKVSTNQYLGYNITGIFHDNNNENYTTNLHYLGSFSDFENYIENNIVDEVIIMFDNDETQKIQKGVYICEKWGVKFTIVPSVFSILPERIFVNNFDGLPVLNIRKVPLENIVFKGLKRLLDIVVSLICLIFLSPLMLATIIIIKATSKGPVFFKQVRVGENRKLFKMFKFRSMKVETESIIKMAVSQDDRCTSFGRFIRKYSIDELPQLINVLIGNMSLVGPRPEIPHFVNEFKDEIPQYMIKHYVKPGMTGWAQVNGLRGNTSIKDRIKYDIHYIEHWSFGFDIKILFLTATKGIFNKNAY